MSALRLDGELTIYTAVEIKLRLMEAIGRSEQLEVDLSEISEVDTAGLQLLILGKQEAARLDRELHYVRHSDPVLELLDFCHLTDRFDASAAPIAEA